MLHVSARTRAVASCQAAYEREIHASEPFGMCLLMIGLDHTTAPVEVRERLAFRSNDLPQALQQARALIDSDSNKPSELVLISTCNRVAFYIASSQPPELTEARIIAFLATFHNIPESAFCSALQVIHDQAVPAHLFATAAGLYSVVLGEAQIQGQVRNAHEVARTAGTIGPVLERLFQHAIATGKRVRRETGLGDGAASVSQAAVEFARQNLGDLTDRAVLLIGSGKMSELAARNLQAYGARRVQITNRTNDHAAELAARCGADAVPFYALGEALTETDIVISSTAAPHLIITRAMVEQALAQRTHSTPLLLIDIAVPRDIESSAGELPNVHLCTIDDLAGVIDRTFGRRAQAMAAAQNIITAETALFHEWLQEREELVALAGLRRQAETLRQAELVEALRQMGELSPAAQVVLERFSRSLVNKLLHNPTVRLRKARRSGKAQDYNDLLRQLFDQSTDAEARLIQE